MSISLVGVFICTMAKVPWPFPQSAVVELHGKGNVLCFKNWFSSFPPLAFSNVAAAPGLRGSDPEAFVRFGASFWAVLVWGSPPPRRCQQFWERQRTPRGGVNPGKVALALPRPPHSAAPTPREVWLVAARDGRNPPRSVWGPVSGEAARRGPAASPGKGWALWWLPTMLCACASGFCRVTPWSLDNCSIVNLILELNALGWEKVVLP